MKKILILILSPVFCFCSNYHIDYIGDYSIRTSISISPFDEEIECGMVSMWWQINYMGFPLKRGVTYIPLDPYMHTLMYENIRNPFFSQNLEEENE